MKEALSATRCVLADQSFAFELAKLEIEPPVLLTKTFRQNLPVRVGAFAKVHGPGLLQWVEFGRYASIAPHAVLGGNEHAMEWLTTSAVAEAPSLHGWDRAVDTSQIPTSRFFSGAIGPIVVGNDVWIGDGAFVRNGITIGDGAVVAARAVVVRDVPPYAIVAGNPARVVRMRFDEALVQRLLSFRWWRYGAADIASVTVDRPERALDELADLEAAGAIAEYRPPWLTSEASRL